MKIAVVRRMPNEVAWEIRRFGVVSTMNRGAIAGLLRGLA